MIISSLAEEVKNQAQYAANISSNFFNIDYMSILNILLSFLSPSPTDNLSWSDHMNMSCLFTVYTLCLLSTKTYSLPSQKYSTHEMYWQLAFTLFFILLNFRLMCHKYKFSDGSSTWTGKLWTQTKKRESFFFIISLYFKTCICMQNVENKVDIIKQPSD